MNDLISRQAAIDIERNATVDTNPSHFEAHQKFTQFMDDAEISSFGRWQWSNGFNTALTAVGIDLKNLPSAQPEPSQVARDIAAIIDNEQDMRVILKAAQQWIPCSERLPDQNGKYLVVGRQKAINILKFDGGRWYGKWGVVAWMPLPSPYREEE